MPTKRDDDEYNMRHARRGRAIILNHELFDRNIAPTRTGSRVDVAVLEHVWNELGFEVSVYDNLAYHEIKELMLSGK